MDNLTFKPFGGWYVTDSLNGGDSGIVAFQLAFPNNGAKVIVEYGIDPDMACVVADAKTAGYAHGDIINGIRPGLNVRIRTNYMPDTAKVKNL